MAAPCPGPQAQVETRGRFQVLLQAVKSDSAQDSGLDSSVLKLISDITAQVDTAVAITVKSNNAASEGVDLTATSQLRSKVLAGIRKLSKGLLERETEVRLLLLAALSSEHLLLLGPPGTAKSELSRRLSTLTGGAYFERLLTRFSVPEELFGPLSMKGLENDLYVRQIDGYLPTAEVAFVDEIFKANSAILNALLTLLNERLFDNGNKRFPVPLLCLVGASNEMPESEELDALYDRFLIRRQVKQVSNAQLHKLARLAAGRELEPELVAAAALSSSSSSSSTASRDADAEAALHPLQIEDFRATADAAYEAVDVPDSVIDVLTNLRNYLQDRCEPPVYVSDRRFMKSVQLLQVAAHGDGRTQVNEYDCLLLEHVYGNRPDDGPKVRAHVLEVIASDPGLTQTELVFLGLFGRACRLLEAGPDGRAVAEMAETTGEANTLVGLLQDRHASLSVALGASFPELRASIWQSAASVQSAVQSLTPQVTENKKKAEDLLREAQVLAECLSRGVPGGVLEKMLPKRFKQYQKGISGKA